MQTMWVCGLIYFSKTHVDGGYALWRIEIQRLIFSWSRKKPHRLSPKDPLGHGRSTVSPRWVMGHWIPRTSLASQKCRSGLCGGRGGRRVTGTVAVIGRRSGCLLMEPIGREVGAIGRIVEGLALEVNVLDGGVVVT